MKTVDDFISSYEAQKNANLSSIKQLEEQINQNIKELIAVDGALQACRAIKAEQEKERLNSKIIDSLVVESLSSLKEKLPTILEDKNVSTSS